MPFKQLQLIYWRQTTFNCLKVIRDNKRLKILISEISVISKEYLLVHAHLLSYPELDNTIDINVRPEK